MAAVLPGTEVSARGLRWEVVFTQPAREQTLWRLRCLQGELQGTEMDLLHPLESIEPIAKEINPEKAAPLAQWRLYSQAFLLEQAFGARAFLAAQPGRLKLASYQLVPVMRALQMSRPRLLLADGVGLGKTVEAGLVLAELVARRRAHRILIVSPAGPLLQQWRAEMRERFGMRFTVLDRDSLQEIRYQNEIGANPFDHVALGLVSVDFAKQEKVLQDLERASYDVVVIDEAHHCAKVGVADDREGSQRRRLAEVLARQADSLLLLTATPHDGHDGHFASLIDLLDPSLVDGRGALRGDAYRRHVVRRLKRHIKDPTTGAELFKQRKVQAREVLFSKATCGDFVDFQRALLALVAPRLKGALAEKRYSDVLAFIALLKRSVSTVEACKTTLQAVADRLELLACGRDEAPEERNQRLRTLREYRKRTGRYGALSPEEEHCLALLETEDMAAELKRSGARELLGKLPATDRKRSGSKTGTSEHSETVAGLHGLICMADKAAAEDPKLAALAREIQNIRAAEPRANVLVYTEYADSLQAAVAHLRARLKDRTLQGQVVAISGDDDEETRIAVTERFRRDEHIILVSTDATSEGLNLHERCHHLVHLELPYNPNRLEQRNGRIDRFGQQAEPQVRYLYLAGTFEERLLLRLVSKYERQRSKLTFVPNTLGVLSSDRGPATVKLLEAAANEELELFNRPEPVRFAETGEQDDTSSVAYRELLAEVEEAFAGYERAAKTHEWLGDMGAAADPEQTRAAADAREQGSRLGVADLTAFVLDAVRADLTSSAVRKTERDVWELRLSGHWTFGLDEMPGYDPDTRVLRLTTDLDKAEDKEGRRVGYLGRAHPLVRRALDRVRNIQLGTNGHSLDRRASAAVVPGAREPALLSLYLGRVQSGAGREFERVVAVKVPRRGAPEVLVDHAAWAPLMALDRAAPTAGVWAQHFEAWARKRETDAAQAAEAALGGIVEALAREHREVLEKENERLEGWLAARAEELCGRAGAAGPPALGAGAQGQGRPRWAVLQHPQERLAALGVDTAVPAARRAEANGVLSLYERRAQWLARRRDLDVPPPALIGVLMLVPEKP